MEFLHPGMLLGLVAVAAPIVLHLIMRQKPKRMEFPALRLVRQRQLSNTRRMRLQHWLLLALRVAALALLALALARPSMMAGGFLPRDESPVAAALVFDTTPRMAYRQQNQTRLEAAQEFARWIVGQLPEGSQIAVMESRLESTVFQVDRASAVSRLDRLEGATRGERLSSVIEAASRLLKTSDNPRRELYLFTDLAKTAWQCDDPERARREIASLEGVATHLIDVGVERPRNSALGEISLSAQVVPRSATPTVRCEIRVTGEDAAAERQVELHLLDALGRPQRRGHTTVTVEPGASAPLSFPLGGLDEGTHQGLLKIVGQDALPVDDTRYFTVEVRPSWKILLLSPSPVDDYTFYLSEALAPEELRKGGRAWFDCRRDTLDALSRLPLREFAAICLLDPSPLSSDAWRKLADYAASGGSVALFLGRNATPTESFNAPLALGLLPGRLDRQARSPEGKLHIVLSNLEHPALARFRSRAGSVPWDQFPVLRYWRLRETADEAAVLARYSDGQPALFERPVGAGRVMTLTTPVSDALDATAWNQLPTGLEPWPFVMLVNETMLYLVGSRDVSFNYQPGQPAVIPLAGGERPSGYLLTTPQGEPLRRTLDSNAATIVESATDWVGNYRVQSGGKADGLDRGFSVNVSAADSDLTRIDPDGLKSLFGELPFQLSRGREEFTRAQNFQQVGQELFPWLIVIVALVMGAEHVMANRFYRDR